MASPSHYDSEPFDRLARQKCEPTRCTRGGGHQADAGGTKAMGVRFQPPTLACSRLSREWIPPTNPVPIFHKYLFYISLKSNPPRRGRRWAPLYWRHAHPPGMLYI
jgi:hypothetical protein